MADTRAVDATIDLLNRVAILEKQVAELQGKPIAGERNAVPTSRYPEGSIVKGQYTGREHDWVVENDPWYVQWLQEKGLAEGFGFTEDQIQTACDDPRPNPRARRR